MRDVPWFSLTAAMVILAFMVIVLWSPAQTVPPPRPRFEQLLNEKANAKDNTSAIRSFEVWQDKETGHEIICARSFTGYDYSLTCWQSGRAWIK